MQKNGGLIGIKAKIKTHRIIILMGFRVFKNLLCDPNDTVFKPIDSCIQENI